METAKRLEFTIYGQPVGKTNMKPIINKRTGHIQSIQTEKNSNYMARVQAALMEQLEKQPDLDMSHNGYGYDVVIIAQYQIQKQHYHFYKKTQKTELDRTGQDKLDGIVRPTIKPDCDNISKIICDAITHLGSVWKDDSEVSTLLVQKKYGEVAKVTVIIETKSINNLLY